MGEQGMRLAAQKVLEALSFLERELEQEVVTLRPEMVRVESDSLRLIDYACLPRQRGLQSVVAHHLMDQLVLPPELFFLPPEEEVFLDHRGAVWGLAVLLLALATLQEDREPMVITDSREYKRQISPLFLKYQEKSVFQKYSYIQTYCNPLEEYLSGTHLSGVSLEMRDFLSQCLVMSPLHRKSYS